jgi:hypothetical protein
MDRQNGGRADGGGDLVIAAEGAHSWFARTAYAMQQAMPGCGMCPGWDTACTGWSQLSLAFQPGREQATENRTLRQTISCMLDDLALRERLKNPLFYLRLLFPR